MLEDGDYNKTDEDCKEVGVNERIGKIEDTEVQGIKMAKVM